MTQKFEMYLKKNWKGFDLEIQIIGNDTADNDYFRMITAPYLICAASSFCLNAAMANYLDTKLVILPSKGSWNSISNLFIKITDKNHTIHVEKLSVPTYSFHEFKTANHMNHFKKWFNA
eukprot:75237_1